METDVEETVGGGQVGCWWGVGGRSWAGWAWNGGATSCCGETATTASSAARNVLEFSAGADSIGCSVSTATSSVSGAAGKCWSFSLCLFLGVSCALFKSLLNESFNEDMAIFVSFHHYFCCHLSFSTFLKYILRSTTQINNIVNSRTNSSKSHSKLAIPLVLSNQ